MKKFLLTVFVSFFVSGLAFSQGGPQKNETLGTFLKIIKNVFQTHEAKNPERVTENNKTSKFIIARDEIRTEDNSVAIVSFLDKSVLKIQPNSLVTISGNTESAGKNSSVNTKSHIGKGSFYFSVKKQGNNSDFKFTTPTMVASIRGTAGLLKAENDSLNQLILEEGSVYIEANNGSKANGTLTAGNTATVTSDGRLLIAATEPEQKKEFEKAKNSDSKQIRINAEKGNLEIFYNDKK
jgi:hypothetical protein